MTDAGVVDLELGLRGLAVLLIFVLGCFIAWKLGKDDGSPD